MDTQIMGSKTISLSDDAYAKLKAEKRDGESFSDVVHRLLSDRQPRFADLAGLMTPKEARKAKALLEELRRRDIEDLKRRYGVD